MLAKREIFLEMQQKKALSKLHYFLFFRFHNKLDLINLKRYRWFAKEKITDSCFL